MGKNIEIKPFEALIPLEEYLKQHSLKEGDSLHIGKDDWTIHSLMPAFDTLIVTNTKKEVKSIKLHDESGNCYIIFVNATCVLKSEIAGLGVEQLNLFKNE